LLLFSNYHASIDGKLVLPINKGTPQGSLISPYIFNLFLNSLLLNFEIDSHLKKIIDLEYADDLATHSRNIYTQIKGTLAINE